MTKYHLHRQTTAMNLYILRPRGVDPVGYDVGKAFVVRAKDSKAARALVATKSGDEGPSFWMYTELSTCRKLKHEGKPEVILVDFKAG